MLQDVQARAIAALPGLDWGLADHLAARLKRDLATLTDLAAAYPQAHRNMLGPGFAELHQLADETRAYADLGAERAVALRGTAHGTPQAAAGRSALAPLAVDQRDERRRLQELSRCVERDDSARNAVAALTHD
jgi:DNA-binding ferritin-like protein